MISKVAMTCTGHAEHELGFLASVKHSIVAEIPSKIGTNRPCQGSFHVPPKDGLISRLTFESASTQIAFRMNARSRFPANNGSDDSDRYDMRK